MLLDHRYETHREWCGDFRHYDTYHVIALRTKIDGHFVAAVAEAVGHIDNLFKSFATDIVGIAVQCP